MESDPATLDPESRFGNLYATASVALGLLSLCASIIPVCGGAMALVGILCGFLARRVEKSTAALVGISFSIIGLLAAIIYAAFVYVLRSP